MENSKVGTMKHEHQIQVHPLSHNPTKAWQTLQVVQKHHKVEPLSFLTPKPEGHARFVCISDTHSQTNKMNVLPDGDVLIHAGDFTNVGRPKEVDEFNEWLGKQPFQYKIVIAGNHELTFDQELVKAGTSPVWQSYFRSTSAASVANIHEKLTDCIYLLDEHINILGFNIYGSPWQPEFCDWGFNLPRGEQLLQTWNKIPDDTDILITHGPPIGHGDKTNDSIRAGCVELLSTIQQRVKPKYHIFGHIHEGYGISTDGVTTYINASICTFNYRPTNLPIIFDLPMQKKK